jgi:hypothetical protein
MHRLKLFAVLLAALALVAAGCGGSKKSSSSASGGDAASILSSISSAPLTGPQKVALNIQLDLKGTPTGQAAVFAGKPIKLDVNGTTDTDAKKNDLTFQVAAGPLTLDGALLQDGANSWLQFQGKWYTLPADALSKTTGTTAGAGASKLSVDQVAKAFGDPSQLLTDTTVVGQEQVDGVQTDHVQGKVDLVALVKGLASLSTQMGSTSSPVSPAEIVKTVTKMKRYIKDSTVDLWVGTDDKQVHKIAVTVDGVTDASAKASSGISGFDLSFDASATSTSSPTITPPADAAPFSQFQQDMGSFFGGSFGGATP